MMGDYDQFGNAFKGLLAATRAFAVVAVVSSIIAVASIIALVFVVFSR